MIPPPPRTTEETEIKIDLVMEPVWEKLCAVLSPPRDEVLQVNRFYDSPSRELAAAGLALRVREEGEALIVSLKGRAHSVGDAVSRLEVEERLPPDLAARLRRAPLSLLQLAITPIAALRDRVAVEELVEVVAFRNLRRRYPRKIAGLPRVIEIDRTEFPDGSVDFELEVEITTTSDETAAEVEATARELRRLLEDNGIAYRRQRAGKFSRALRRQRARS